MTAWFYRLLCVAGRLFGGWFVALFARFVAVGYFCFSPKVVESVRFYRRLLPGRRPLFYRWCTFLQYQRFTTIHADRFLSGVIGRQPTFSSSGWDRLTTLSGDGGAILLMSHLGNWEMAAQLLKQRRQKQRVLLFMGIKQKEGIEKAQKDDLRRAGISIVGVRRGDSSPLGVVEAVSCLRDGGIVSLPGDVVWGDGQRRVTVSFLGGQVFLPAAPYVLALLSGAPLMAFFSFRTGTNEYAFSLLEPISVRRVGRGDREAAIAEAAQCYADQLEHALRSHPFEWYHFERFVH